MLASALLLLPLAGTVHAVPAKGGICYTAECHTLGAALAAPAGKGVTNVLLRKLIGSIATPTDGIFERNWQTGTGLPPHALGTTEWDTELKCVGCHTNIQSALNKNNYHSTHPVYSVAGTAPNANHLRCTDCHDAAVVNGNYHTADGAGSWLRWSGQALCDKCHVGVGIDAAIGTVAAGFRIQRDPVNTHGVTKYDTTKWTSCYDGTYTNGCHNAHAHAVNNGLVGITNYDLTGNNWNTYDVCVKCHPAQDPLAGGAADYFKKHDYDRSYTAQTECDVCHNFVISADKTYQTAGYHTDGTTPLRNSDAAVGTTMTATDAFCLQCHDGTYPVTQPFTGWQGGGAGHGVGQAANVDVDGNAVNWGYDVNGHGLNSGSFYSRAAWRTVAGNGNPSPVDRLPAQFTNTRSCYSCHSPHATANQYIIKATVNGNAVTADGTSADSSACTACHNATTNIDGGGTPAASLFQGLNKANYDASAHATVGLLSCYGDPDGLHTRGGCHDPHGTGTGVTPYKGMAIPGTEQAGCTGINGCHGLAAAGSTWNKSATGEFSLASTHTVTADGAGGLEVECTNCHNPHLATVADPVVNPDAITTVAVNAASPGAPVPNFDKFTDFCMGCHDGAAPPAGYGVQMTAAQTARSHWGPGASYAPSENPVFQTECWHCHDSHGSQNIKLVGNSRNTNPGVTAGVDPMVVGNRAVYNVYDTVWAPAAAGTNNLVYAASTAMDPTANGNNDGSTVSDDGLCDRCHRSTRGDNATHIDAFGVDCATASCHQHNGVIATYPAGFPTLAAHNCFVCHSAATNNIYKTSLQYLAAHGGTMATGTDHNITYATDATNNCYKCHVLNDGTYPHKSGTVALKVGATATVYSTSGDYKMVQAAAPVTTLATAVGFCLNCHGNTTIADSAANFTGYTSANTPQVSTEATGSNYRTYGHGAGVTLSGGRAGVAALECATCHQYHGGTVTQGAPRTIVNTINNGAMIDSLLTGATTYPYTIGNASDKDGFCALTCHQASTTVDNAAYATGIATIDHYWNEPGDVAKTLTGCPQTAAPWDDCETHPTNQAITVGLHFKLPPNLPLASYYDTQLGARGALPGTGNLLCTTCHDPHARTVPADLDKQMLRLTATGAVNICLECHQ
jgi:predicted CXXCH cytochrome family protein